MGVAGMEMRDVVSKEERLGIEGKWENEQGRGTGLCVLEVKKRRKERLGLNWVCGF